MAEYIKKSGPGSLAVSKLLLPETEESCCVRAEDLEFDEAQVICHYSLMFHFFSEENNVLEAVTNGSVVG